MAGALRSFPIGSAPGPSILQANLKEAVFCSSPSRVNQSVLWLTKLVKLLCAGNIPQDVIPYLYGASLLPCNKKDRGLCPIAVGEVLRLLTSKCVARSGLPEAVQILSPLQVGVGLPGGYIAILRYVSNVQENFDISPNHCFTILVDFSNTLKFSYINQQCSMK